MKKVDAWVLFAGKKGQRAELVREPFELPPLGDHDVLARPLYGCWEGNMGHAVQREPIDICKERNEPKVVIGNAGVVRVLEVGRSVTSVVPGQRAIIFCNGEPDRFGYPKKILGYDARRTMGCLAKEMTLKDKHLVPIPENTRHSMAQWAAFSLRYVTAWANWRLALGTLRLQLDARECPAPTVWGWGGGVSFAELDLARRHGARAVMVSGSPRRFDLMRKAGIDIVDRRVFGELWYDEDRYGKDDAYRDQYRAAEQAFLAEVHARTGGEMVHVFLDYIGGPVYRATLKALARQGVIATAGWKHGMTLSQLRAVECIQRHQHVNTHYARYEEGVAAVEYAEREGWMPTVDSRVYSFEEIPLLAEAYLNDATDYFPCFEVSPE